MSSAATSGAVKAVGSSPCSVATGSAEGSDAKEGSGAKDGSVREETPADRAAGVSVLLLTSIAGASTAGAETGVDGGETSMVGTACSTRVAAASVTRTTGGTTGSVAGGAGCVPGSTAGGAALSSEKSK